MVPLCETMISTHPSVAKKGAEEAAMCTPSLPGPQGQHDSA